MNDEVSALLRWLHAHDLPSEVVLACEGAHVPKVGRRRQIVVWKGCLTQASIGLPAQLLALGIERVSVLPCPHDHARLDRHLRRWESLTPGLVGYVDLRKRALLAGPAPLRLGQIALPRRVLLGLGLRDKQPIPIRADDTARTLAAIEVLTARGLVSRGEGIHSHLGGVRLGATGCTACGVCVQACPHHALELRHDASGSQLWQNAQECRGEQRCVQLCPVQALWVQGPMRLVDVLDEPQRRLGVVSSARCVRCGAPHPASEGNTCQVCAYRLAHPFGSTMPPSQL